MRTHPQNHQSIFVAFFYCRTQPSVVARNEGEGEEFFLEHEKDWREMVNYNLGHRRQGHQCDTENLKP